MKTAFALLLILAVGCGAPGNAPAPQSAILLLDESSASDRARAAASFEQWLSASIHAPGAVFRMKRIGGDRRSAQTVFTAQIPASWGAPNAVANKAAFLARARHAFAEALASRPPAVPDVPAVNAPTTITVLPPLDSRGKPWVWMATGLPVHVAVICDASPSAAASACSGGTLVGSFDAWLSGDAAAGSSFRVWLVGTDIGSATRIFEVTTPDLPLVERVAALLGARQELVQILARVPRDAGSAVAETLTVALDDLAGRRGIKQLFVLSDLRQTTPGVWAFDEQVPASKSFLAWLEAERLLPDGRGVGMRICGLHFRPAPGQAPFDARRAAELKAVWRGAFGAMHPDSLTLHGECDAETFTNIREVMR